MFFPRFNLANVIFVDVRERIYRAIVWVRLCCEIFIKLFLLSFYNIRKVEFFLFASCIAYLFPFATPRSYHLCIQRDGKSSTSFYGNTTTKTILSNLHFCTSALFSGYTRARVYNIYCE